MNLQKDPQSSYHACQLPNLGRITRSQKFDVNVYVYTIFFITKTET